MSDFVLVPKEPTEEMFRAAGAAWGAPGCQRVIEIVWPALLAAAAASPAVNRDHLFDEMRKALEEIAGLRGLCLLGPRHDQHPDGEQLHEAGSHKAFNQAADFAEAALSKIKAHEE